MDPIDYEAIGSINAINGGQLMGDVEEEKLDEIQDTLREEAIKGDIAEVEEEVKEEVEEVKEEIEELEELVEELVDKPPDVIVTPPAEIDYDLLADKVADRLKPAEPVVEDDIEDEEVAEETPDEDEPPGSNSFLFKRRV